MPRSETLVADWIARDGFLVHPGMAAAGLRHGMTTRLLGNMKDGAVRGAAAARLDLPEPLTLKQVHGTVIHRAAASALGLEGDGWTLGPGDEGLCVGVYVADCVPLYLWSDDGKYAGVFHAGWRGMAAGMPTKAVAALVARGAKAASLNAALGAHIGTEAYKVGPEFADSFPASSLPRREDGLRLSLHADASRQLLLAGVRPGAIAEPAPCTASNPDAYFSFRRDKQDARMLALLALR